MTYQCPVCGYDGLHERPRGSYENCDSCGFEFGYHDDDQCWSYAQWRRRWIANGMPFENAESVPPPPGWDPEIQLAGLPQKSDVQEFIDCLLLQAPQIQPLCDEHTEHLSDTDADERFFAALAGWIDSHLHADPDHHKAQWLIPFLAHALEWDTDKVRSLIVDSFITHLPPHSPVLPLLNPTFDSGT